MTNMPEVVSPEKWQEERDELLKLEKEATRTLDALAARRRRLPMVKFDTDRYVSIRRLARIHSLTCSQDAGNSSSTNSWTTVRMPIAQAAPTSPRTWAIWER